MTSVKELIHNRKFIKGALIALIVIYPLAGAFLGLDLGDTGYHLYAYRNLLSHPDKVNYTTYFSSVIGYLWGCLFDGLGLLGYNLLEVFLEWGLVCIVYRTLKKDLGEINVLAGCLLAVAAADTYLNIFNYHQFNAFLLTSILCLEYAAITEDRKRLSLGAGVLYTLVVFSRVGSVVALVTCALYVYHAVMNDSPWKEAWKHIGAFCAGGAGMAAVLILGLFVTGRMDFFIANILRLGGIASDSSSSNSYGFVNLLKSLVKDNLKVIASGVIFYGAVVLLILGLNIAMRKCAPLLKKIFCVLLGLFVAGIGLYQMYFAYGVNPAENWPQMTTGQRFVIGVMYVTAFFCYAYHVFKKEKHSQNVSMLVIAACMLVILVIAGSNTGTKHVILGLWLLAPVCVYTVRSLVLSPGTRDLAGRVLGGAGLELFPQTLKWAAAAALLMFFLKYGHMLYYTFNYDEVNRTKLTATVDNDKVRGILTTQREAQALNEVLEVLEKHDPDMPLMVYGNSLLFYYMTGRDSYGMPWVTQTTYPLERYQEDLEKAEEEYGETLPLVIYCRTNYAYGFSEETLLSSHQEGLQNLHNGKKEYFLRFLEKNNYGIWFMNDYYAVIVPKITMDMKGLENVIFGW